MKPCPSTNDYKCLRKGCSWLCSETLFLHKAVRLTPAGFCSWQTSLIDGVCWVITSFSKLPSYTRGRVWALDPSSCPTAPPNENPAESNFLSVFWHEPFKVAFCGRISMASFCQDTSQSLLVKMQRIEQAQSMAKAPGSLGHFTNLGVRLVEQETS